MALSPLEIAPLEMAPLEMAPLGIAPLETISLGMAMMLAMATPVGGACVSLGLPMCHPAVGWRLEADPILWRRAWFARGGRASRSPGGGSRLVGFCN